MIRHATDDDAAAMSAIYAPYVEGTVISFEEVAPTADEMLARLKAHEGVLPWLVAEEGGEVVGYAYAWPHRERRGYRWAVDTSVYIAEAHQGRGYGRALYRELLAILERQRLVAAYAGIGLPNPASVRLHESIGFTPVGVYREVGFKSGRWVDVGWWVRPLATRSDPPLEPIPLRDLVC